MDAYFISTPCNEVKMHGNVFNKSTVLYLFSFLKEGVFFYWNHLVNRTKLPFLKVIPVKQTSPASNHSKRTGMLNSCAEYSFVLQNEWLLKFNSSVLRPALSRRSSGNNSPALRFLHHDLLSHSQLVVWGMKAAFYKQTLSDKCWWYLLGRNAIGPGSIMLSSSE